MSGRQTPPDLARELLEEIDIVGALGRLADQFIDLMGVRPDQNAPLVGLDSVEDDRCRFGGAGRRLLAEPTLAARQPAAGCRRPTWPRHPCPSRQSATGP